MLKHAVDGALVLALLDGLALVVLALASGYGYDELCQASLVDEKTQRHDGDTGLQAVLGNAANLLAVEQKLAVAMSRVVVVGAETVFSNIHVLDPHLVVDDHAIGISQSTLALTDGLDLGARQDDARREGFDDLIIEGRLAVLDIDGIVIVVACHSRWIQTVVNKFKIALSSSGSPSNNSEEMTTNLGTLSFLTNRWSVPR